MASMWRPGDTAVSKPRITAQINGYDVNSLIGADLRMNGSCRSSQFGLTISTTKQGGGASWLAASRGMITVNVLIVSQTAAGSITTFQGLADNLAYDPINRTARLMGRDFSAILSKSSWQESYYNQTASEIATRIALRHGFVPKVEATSRLVGSYEGDNHSQLLLNAHSRITTEWALLKYLAGIEGFQLFVTGTTLVFASQSSLRPRYISIHDCLVKNIRFYRTCPLSNQTRIIVKTWNSWGSEMISSSIQQSQSESPTGSGYLGLDPGIDIALVKPNLLSTDTEELARRYSAKLNERELSVEIALLGESSIVPGDIITIDGNGALFDEDYVVTSIHRRFSSTAGFTESIHGLVGTRVSSSTTGSTQ